MLIPASSCEDASKPLVRRAREGDAAAILRMVEQLARHHGDDPTASVAALERDILGPDPWVLALVAEQASTLLGYAILCRVYRAQFAERGMDIHHLFVVEQARNLGLGRRLFEAALDEAQRWGCKFLVVGTHPENVRAERFYERLGFKRATQGGPRFRMVLAASR